MVYAFPYHLNKRAAKFVKCDSHTPAISNVTLSPDSPKAGSNLEVKGSATTNDAIVNGDTFNFVILDLHPENPSPVFVGPTVDICTKTKCPTNTFIFDKTYDLSRVASLPSGYLIAITIEPSDRDPTKIKACAVGP
ncbi:6344_t:CDS:1 [Cetraspora pellucida]|uniref:6344_t:CDS:1 n=1 Tax=Cetraspora pellucida TaxID=1433469 RepID=A0A9N9EIY5_9GLOM|nr:6344_t:CDS:1 [Cetraspora pellucida]